MTRPCLVPASYASIITADLIEAAERDLAVMQDELETETDPRWRDVLAQWLADDTAWLAGMRKVAGVGQGVSA